MSEISSKITEIKIEMLIPFRQCPSQTYEGARLEQLMDSIAREGLISPVIVRPVDGGKYEIICGHNRVKAMKALGHDAIPADVRDELSDNEALELFYDSNLNQQSFSDWDYKHRLEAIKYSEKLLRENSQQGRRTDLEKKRLENAEDGTSGQTRQKLAKVSKKETSRDRMARWIGISTATFNKYKRIIKLTDDQVKSIAQLLDEKRMTFEAAYMISGLKPYEVKVLVNCMVRNTNKMIDMEKLKTLCSKSKSITFPIPDDEVKEVVVFKEPSIIKFN